MLNIILLIVFTTFWRSSHSCAGTEIVSRAEWHARQPKWTVPIHRQVEHVFIAHTVTPECYNKEMCSARMRSMQNFHMDKQGFSDISYTFVIGGDGRVYEGVGWTRQGVHTYGWNSKSHGIAFIGNYMNISPNSQMLNAARQLIICGIQQGYISRTRQIHGARDGTCTLSPGDALYRIIQQWPRFKGGKLEGYKC